MENKKSKALVEDLMEDLLEGDLSRIKNQSYKECERKSADRDLSEESLSWKTGLQTRTMTREDAALKDDDGVVGSKELSKSGLQRDETKTSKRAKGATVGASPSSQLKEKKSRKKSKSSRKKKKLSIVKSPHSSVKKTSKTSPSLVKRVLEAATRSSVKRPESSEVSERGFDFSKGPEVKKTSRSSKVSGIDFTEKSVVKRPSSSNFDFSRKSIVKEVSPSPLDFSEVSVSKSKGSVLKSEESVLKSEESVLEPEDKETVKFPMAKELSSGGSVIRDSQDGSLKEKESQGGVPAPKGESQNEESQIIDEMSSTDLKKTIIYPVPPVHSVVTTHGEDANEKTHSPPEDMPSLNTNLVHAQDLKMAQQKITYLEKEIENLRLDNDKLIMAGEALRGQNEELIIQFEGMKKSTRESMLKPEELSPGGSVIRDSQDGSFTEKESQGGVPVPKGESQNEKSQIIDEVSSTELKKTIIYPVSSVHSVVTTHGKGVDEKTHLPPKDMPSLNMNLVQAQNLKMAQQKITCLEKEIENLRLDNDKLTMAGEALKDQNEELIIQFEEMKKSTDEELDHMEKEKDIVSDLLNQRDKKITQLLSEKEVLEKRLESNFRKIRVRERELENRLELARVEHIAINNSKDEVVLDLKRQVDQLSSELESLRNKGQDLNNKLDEKREALQRTVKALRLALIMLEGGNTMKKSG